ncbi:hypothetical protein POTOM_012760 [Populus tomentosa]|uniref:Hydroxyproline O-arabinosyltransferase-like domain-containing protein n=1 Tax=Populus tomentosa TaxID=118781 RepID=A0A8X8A7V1_POPTO|nr:hypothetical protein POTOM_012760 [Populus tomentosa]
MGQPSSPVLILLTFGFFFATYNLLTMKMHNRSIGKWVYDDSVGEAFFDPVIEMPEEVKKPKNARMPFHVALTATDAPYSKWQCRIMYYWYKKNRDLSGSEMGGFTRILHSGKPDNLMDEMPTVVVDPLPAGLDREKEKQFGDAQQVELETSIIPIKTVQTIPTEGDSDESSDEEDATTPATTQQESIATSKPKRVIKKLARYCDMVAYALPVIDDGIPYTYKEAVQSGSSSNIVWTWSTSLGVEHLQGAAPYGAMEAALINHEDWMEKSCQEPDHILVNPLPNLARGGLPVAFPFFYIEPAKFENIVRKYYTEEKGPVTDIDPIGNSPVIIKKVFTLEIPYLLELLEKIAPTWMNVSLKMKNDRETDKAFGWVLEMYAYAVAAALNDVQHVLRKDFMLQPPWDLSTRKFFIIHYTYGCDYNLKGQLTYGKIGEWRFDKRSFLRGPPPKNIPLPPPGVPESVVTLVKMVNEATSNIPDWDAE